MTKRLLLLSNSTMKGQQYLGWPQDHITDFFGREVKTILFIPYAGVTFSFDEYAESVGSRFNELGYRLQSIHKIEIRKGFLDDFDAIVVGGGNTFQLTHLLQKHNLVGMLRDAVLQGMPFIGWSAGSNIACPSIRTTNDMPVIEPESFQVLNLIPFQINPHYTEATIPDHGGESRQMRIEEFITVNQDTKVVGLPEGSLLRIENEKMTYFGQGKCKLFAYGADQQTFHDGQDMSWLLGKG